MKDCLQDTSMDDDTFEAARETCLVLGGKLGSIRNQQLRCYDEIRELELMIDKEGPAWLEDKSLVDIDLSSVRGRTPVRKLSPTPLERHRSCSREPADRRTSSLSRLSQAQGSIVYTYSKGILNIFQIVIKETLLKGRIFVDYIVNVRLLSVERTLQTPTPTSLDQAAASLCTGAEVSQRPTHSDKPWRPDKQRMRMLRRLRLIRSHYQVCNINFRWC